MSIETSPAFSSALRAKKDRNEGFHHHDANDTDHIAVSRIICFDFKTAILMESSNQFLVLALSYKLQPIQHAS